MGEKYRRQLGGVFRLQKEFFLIEGELALGSQRGNARCEAEPSIWLPDWP
jgi:hypothetical protein